MPPRLKGEKALGDANVFKEQLPCQDASAGGILERFNEVRSHKSSGRFPLLWGPLKNIGPTRFQPGGENKVIRVGPPVDLLLYQCRNLLIHCQRKI